MKDRLEALSYELIQVHGVIKAIEMLFRLIDDFEGHDETLGSVRAAKAMLGTILDDLEAETMALSRLEKAA